MATANEIEARAKIGIVITLKEKGFKGIFVDYLPELTRKEILGISQDFRVGSAVIRELIVKVRPVT